MQSTLTSNNLPLLQVVDLLAGAAAVLDAARSRKSVDGKVCSCGASQVLSLHEGATDHQPSMLSCPSVG